MTVPSSRSVPDSVARILAPCQVDPRPLSDFFCLADGPEFIKIARLKQAHEMAAVTGRHVYECCAWFGGAVFTLIFVAVSDGEVEDRMSVLAVLGS